MRFRFLKNNAACFSDSFRLGWRLSLSRRGASPLKHRRNSITLQTSSATEGLDKITVPEIPGTNLCCVFYFKMFSDIMARIHFFRHISSSGNLKNDTLSPFSSLYAFFVQSGTQQFVGIIPHKYNTTVIFPLQVKAKIQTSFNFKYRTTR